MNIFQCFGVDLDLVLSQEGCNKRKIKCASTIVSPAQA